MTTTRTAFLRRCFLAATIGVRGQQQRVGAKRLVQIEVGAQR